MRSIVGAALALRSIFACQASAQTSPLPIPDWAKVSRYVCLDDVMTVLASSGKEVQRYTRSEDKGRNITPFLLDFSKNSIPDPKWFIGSDQTGELKAYCSATTIAVVTMLPNRVQFRFQGDSKSGLRGFPITDYLWFGDDGDYLLSYVFGGTLFFHSGHCEPT